jgi:hypothetical protein
LEKKISLPKISFNFLKKTDENDDISSVLDMFSISTDRKYERAPIFGRRRKLNYMIT